MESQNSNHLDELNQWIDFVISLGGYKLAIVLLMMLVTMAPDQFEEQQKAISVTPGLNQSAEVIDIPEDVYEQQYISPRLPLLQKSLSNSLTGPLENMRSSEVIASPVHFQGIDFSQEFTLSIPHPLQEGESETFSFSFPGVITAGAWSEHHEAIGNFNSYLHPDEKVLIFSEDTQSPKNFAPILTIHSGSVSDPSGNPRFYPGAYLSAAGVNAVDSEIIISQLDQQTGHVTDFSARVVDVSNISSDDFWNSFIRYGENGPLYFDNKAGLATPDENQYFRIVTCGVDDKSGYEVYTLEVSPEK